MRRGEETHAVPVPEKCRPVEQITPRVAIQADETGLGASTSQEVGQVVQKRAARVDYFGGMVKVTQEGLEIAAKTNPFNEPGAEQVLKG